MENDLFILVHTKDGYSIDMVGEYSYLIDAQNKMTSIYQQWCNNYSDDNRNFYEDECYLEDYEAVFNDNGDSLHMWKILQSNSGNRVNTLTINDSNKGFIRYKTAKANVGEAYADFIQVCEDNNIELENIVYGITLTDRNGKELSTK